VTGLARWRPQTPPRILRLNQPSQEDALPVSPKLIEAINREIQQVPIEDKRWPELAIELDQLRAAAEAALAVHDFDRDPADFQAVLHGRKS
jgi:hypothetical protein